MECEIEDGETFLDVLASLPRVAEFIATIADEKRGRALEAAEQSYLNTARELGYPEADAQLMGLSGNASSANCSW